MLIVVVGAITIVVLVAVVVSCVGNDVSAHCKEAIIIINRSIDPLRCVTDVCIKCSDELFMEGWQLSEQRQGADQWFPAHLWVPCSTYTLY